MLKVLTWAKLKTPSVMVDETVQDCKRNIAVLWRCNSPRAFVILTPLCGISASFRYQPGAAELSTAVVKLGQPPSLARSHRADDGVMGHGHVTGQVSRPSHRDLAK